RLAPALGDGLVKIPGIQDDTGVLLHQLEGREQALDRLVRIAAEVVPCESPAQGGKIDPRPVLAVDPLLGLGPRRRDRTDLGDADPCQTSGRGLAPEQRPQGTVRIAPAPFRRVVPRAIPGFETAVPREQPLTPGKRAAGVFDPDQVPPMVVAGVPGAVLAGPAPGQ